MFSEQPRSFARFTLSCGWYYFNSSQSCSTKPSQAWNGWTNAEGWFSVWDYYSKALQQPNVVLHLLLSHFVLIKLIVFFKEMLNYTSSTSWIKNLYTHTECRWHQADDSWANFELNWTRVSTEVWILPFQNWPRLQAACRAFHWSLGNACRGHFGGYTHLLLSHSSLLACGWQWEFSVHTVNTNEMK